ncbi:hypothetical protein ACOMHN_002550 [Nucella lapillus]
MAGSGSSWVSDRGVCLDHFLHTAHRLTILSTLPIDWVLKETAQGQGVQRPGEEKLLDSADNIAALAESRHYVQPLVSEVVTSGTSVPKDHKPSFHFTVEGQRSSGGETPTAVTSEAVAETGEGCSWSCPLSADIRAERVESEDVKALSKGSDVAGRGQ